MASIFWLIEAGTASEAEGGLDFTAWGYEVQLEQGYEPITMSQSLKLTLWAVGGLLGIAILGAVIMLLWWRGHAKPQLEAAASDSLGMEVRIGGRLLLQYFPSEGMTLEGARILIH